MLQLSYVHEIAFPIGPGHAQLDMGNILTWCQTKRFHPYSTHVAEPSTPRLPFYLKGVLLQGLYPFSSVGNNVLLGSARSTCKGRRGPIFDRAMGPSRTTSPAFEAGLTSAMHDSFLSPLWHNPCRTLASTVHPPPWEKKLPVPRVLIACDGLNRHLCDRIPRSCAGFGSQACAIAPDLSLIASRGPNRLLVGRGRRLEGPEAQE
eukprot:scaffold544_cov320-Pavlova_lutheri.AAC.54